MTCYGVSWALLACCDEVYSPQCDNHVLSEELHVVCYGYVALPERVLVAQLWVPYDKLSLRLFLDLPRYRAGLDEKIMFYLGAYLQHAQQRSPDPIEPILFPWEGYGSARQWYDAH